MTSRCTYHAMRVARSCNLFQVSLRRFSFSPALLYTNVSENTISYQVGSAIGKLRNSFTKYVMKSLVSKNLYESCADKIPYNEFFKVCGLPDTMQSWFYIMELHVWMVLVRLKPCGTQGKNISYKMVEIMWEDIEQRIRLIGVTGTTDLKESMEEFNQQFHGLIIAFDEALLSHDTVLASALWRNLFAEKSKSDPENIALLVEYIRKQIHHLESLDSEALLNNGEINWLPLITPLKDS
ncbi:ubiquinol-cytochrome-c reductase complex assembly factor 1 isoform X3 [Hydra vulgaris]|uniref:Ubiquinol-cytochrome-c reductase complex assembly factor 1 isoform X3 n=1 Tax=Hydra vulgaris TaxID=6087 RepID=A0ABM4BTG9_HYDVU